MPSYVAVIAPVSVDMSLGSGAGSSLPHAAKETAKIIASRIINIFFISVSFQKNGVALKLAALLLQLYVNYIILNILDMNQKIYFGVSDSAIKQSG